MSQKFLTKESLQKRSGGCHFDREPASEDRTNCLIVRDIEILRSAQDDRPLPKKLLKESLGHDTRPFSYNIFKLSGDRKISLISSLIIQLPSKYLQNGYTLVMLIQLNLEMSFTRFVFIVCEVSFSWSTKLRCQSSIVSKAQIRCPKSCRPFRLSSIIFRTAL